MNCVGKCVGLGWDELRWEMDWEMGWDGMNWLGNVLGWDGMKWVLMNWVGLVWDELSFEMGCVGMG